MPEERPEREDRERRFLAARMAVAARAEGDESASPGALEGYAAVFNQETEIGSWYPFREQFAKGSFRETIKEDDQRALIDHDTAKIIGRTSAGTLSLKEDDKGLKATIDLPDTSYARDLYQSVKRGDIDGMSIGFTVEEEKREVGKGQELDLYTVTRAKLFEVSPVTFPAYEGTSVSARCMERRSKSAKVADSDGEYDARMKMRERRLRMLQLGIEEGRA